MWSSEIAFSLPWCYSAGFWVGRFWNLRHTRQCCQHKLRGGTWTLCLCKQQKHKYDRLWLSSQRASRFWVCPSGTPRSRRWELRRVLAVVRAAFDHLQRLFSTFYGLTCCRLCPLFCHSTRHKASGILYIINKQVITLHHGYIYP